MPSIHVGIHGQEAVGLCKLAEESACDLLYALHIKLQVVPGRAVGNHIPAQRVGSVLLYGAKGIYGVAQTLGHLHAVLIQYQAVAYHGAVSHAVEYHCAQSMQGVEPSACLVNTLGYKVGRESLVLVDGLAVFEGVVHLCIGHGTAVEPHVYQVGFSCQLASAGTYQHDVIHHGAVQVDAVIVLLAHVAGYKTFVLERIGCHDACCHALLYLLVEFLQRTDAQFLTGVTVAPDGQRSAPIAASREVPVVEVLEPFAEAACASALGLPVDGVVQFHHALSGL